MDSDLRWAVRGPLGLSSWLSTSRARIVRDFYKLRNGLIIESKLVLKTASILDSGKYLCSTFNSLNPNLSGLNSSEVEFKVVNSKFLLNDLRPEIACPEKMLRTYKGNFKWPRTTANNVARLKCPANSEVWATFECLSDGKWASSARLIECHFDSNLTRHLEALSKTNAPSEDIDELLRHFASQLNNINPYDVLFAQRILSLRASRRELLLFADLLGKLSIASLNQAKALEPATFSAFFSTLLPAALSMGEEESPLFSSYVAAASLTFNSSQCFLDKHRFTQQMFFNCDKILDTARVSSSLPIVFAIFDTSNLFPSATLTEQSVKSFDDALVESRLDEGLDLSSQVFAFLDFNQNISRFNLSLETRLPNRLYRTLSLIEAKILNRSRLDAQKTAPNVQLSLFEQVFSEDNIFNASYADIGLEDGSELLVHEKLKKLENEIAAWHSTQSFRVLFGSSLPNASLSWNATGLNCSILSLEQRYKYKEPISSSLNGDLRLLSRLECWAWPSLKSETRFVALKFHGDQMDIERETSDKMNDNKSIQLVQLVRAYEKLFGLDQQPSLLAKISADYVFFANRAVYFASALACLLLLGALVAYLACSTRLLMPRAFFHIYVNIWMATLLLLLVFVLGIAQTGLPSLCLVSAFLGHYLTLSLNSWYLLFFYALFFKLDKLKRRNYKLILDEAHQVYLAAPMPEPDEDEYVPRPVVHLYMLGWGAPLLLCLAVLSICKREYVLSPFDACFINNYTILVCTLLVPVIIMLCLIVLFVLLAAFTLRRIVKDLKRDSDETPKPLTPNEANCDKEALCQRWTNTDQVDQDDEKKPSSLYQSTTPPDSCSISSQSSARTSVMDTQHRPSTQLGLTLLSLVLLVAAWLSGAALLGSNSLAVRFSLDTARALPLLKGILSYMFAFLCLAFAFLQLSFYVLSRGDLFTSEYALRLNFAFWKRFLGRKKLSEEKEWPCQSPIHITSEIESPKQGEDELMTTVAPMAQPESESSCDTLSSDPKPARKQHVRNASILSGCNTAQVLGDYDTLAQQSSLSSTRKRPLYVFVDYAYEEKMMQKIKSVTNSPNCTISDNCGVEPQAKTVCRSVIYEDNVKCRLLYGNVARPANPVASPAIAPLNDSSLFNTLLRLNELEAKQETSV